MCTEVSLQWGTLEPDQTTSGKVQSSVDSASAMPGPDSIIHALKTQRFTPWYVPRIHPGRMIGC